MKITLLLYKKLKLIHRSIVKHKIFVKTLKRMFLYMIQILASVILGSKKPRIVKIPKQHKLLKFLHDFITPFCLNIKETFQRCLQENDCFANLFKSHFGMSFLL